MAAECQADELRPDILAVDDNPINLRLLSGMLAKQGYKVRSVTNGETALKAARAQLPDIILLDIMMPQMNGYQVCQQLKADELTASIPVIFISALDEVPDKVTAFQVGGADYISKPFQIEEVLVRLENQLRLQSLQRQLGRQNQKLQQEIQERRAIETQLVQQSQTLDTFSQNLKHLHRLNTTNYQNPNELFVDYLQTGCEILNCQAGIVSRIKGSTFYVEESHSNPRTHQFPTQLRLDQTYCAAVIAQQATIAHNPIPASWRDRPFYQNQQFEGYLGTPIRVNHEIYGTLSFYQTRNSSDPLSDRDREIVELMAQSLGKYIAARHTEIERRRAEEETQLLLDLTQAIGSAPDFDTALSVTLHHVCQATGWQYGEVWTPALDGDTLECNPSWWSRNLTPELQEFRHYSEALTFLPGEGLPGQAWQSGEAQWLKTINADTEDPFLRLELARQCQLTAAFAIPIIAHPAAIKAQTQTLRQSQPPAVLAILVFFTNKYRPQDQRFGQLVSTIAVQIATLVQQKKIDAEMRALWTAMTDTVAVRDASGYCLKVAPTNARHVELRPNLLLGRTLDETFPELTAQHILQTIRKVLAEQIPIHIEYNLTATTSDTAILPQEVWFAETISPLSAETTIHVARDISHSKRLESLLRSSEGKMRAVFEAMTDIVLTISLEGETIGNIEVAPTNPSRLYATNYDPVGQTVNQFAQPAGTAWIEKIRECLATQKTLQWDYGLQLGDRGAWFSVSIAPLSEDAVIWVARDISDRKTTEVALAISQERLRLALEGSRLGLWDWNIATDEVYFSPEWKQMLGYAENDIHDSMAAWERLMHPEDLPDTVTALRKHLNGETNLYQREFRLRSVSGEWQWILSHGKVFERDEAGNPTRITGTHQDINDRKRREEALQLIVQGTASQTGNAFFESCARSLAQVLQVRYALVCQRLDGQNVRTLAFWQDREFGETFEYNVAETPSELVLQGQKCYWRDRIQSYFPKDFHLARWGVRSYLGVPLTDATNRAIGYLAVLDTAPLDDDATTTSIVRIFAARAGAELERQLAENALRASEVRYRSLYNDTPVMLQSCDPQFCLISVSDYWLEYLGYARQEVIGRPMTDFMPVKSRKYAENVALPKLVATGVEKDTPYQLVKKGGKIIDVLCSTILERNDEGEMVRTLSTIVDVTEQKRAELALRLAQQKSERLLLNVLPKAIAERLKNHTGAIAEQYDEVTILFADIVNFTPLASRLSPIELVNLLNKIFSTFDKLADYYDLEKIKTIGDAYMVVGGLPNPQADRAEAIARMALAMQEAMNQFKIEHDPNLQIRIGINTGSVVAGVIGIKKFIYDLWGDAVNVASRMESQGQPGRIQVTAHTYQRLKDQFSLTRRGRIQVKGKGKMTTYWLTGANDDQEV
ncbi:MAG: adenylate/guanylate cyclase domain-containing protein [Jaaginema sp. PMC 1079.18]|nr:adenylate/guanylate cyclase domain-containing protein [Jaaginema sp. PMC 1080.18]MEC4850070.1 adenylate/guanylate cyclase domain-containing protein [Jaaginema sp. PMC 1079.18]MEC4864627.1 adenylate/guanylate cyclase domain-containing protein [Jaaginema sp. PMC 1078.18]